MQLTMSLTMNIGMPLFYLIKKPSFTVNDQPIIRNPKCQVNPIMSFSGTCLPLKKLTIRPKSLGCKANCSCFHNYY